MSIGTTDTDRYGGVFIIMLTDLVGHIGHVNDLSQVPSAHLRIPARCLAGTVEQRETSVKHSLIQKSGILKLSIILVTVF